MDSRLSPACGEPDLEIEGQAAMELLNSSHFVNISNVLHAPPIFLGRLERSKAQPGDVPEPVSARSQQLAAGDRPVRKPQQLDNNRAGVAKPAS